MITSALVWRSGTVPLHWLSLDFAGRCPIRTSLCPSRLWNCSLCVLFRSILDWWSTIFDRLDTTSTKSQHWRQRCCHLSPIQSIKIQSSSSSSSTSSCFVSSVCLRAGCTSFLLSKKSPSNSRSSLSSQFLTLVPAVTQSRRWLTAGCGMLRRLTAASPHREHANIGMLTDGRKPIQRKWK